MITVGILLKNARQEKGLTFFDVEKKLRIREKYIKAIENEDWKMFTSKIYIVGILKNYSNLLGLDNKKVLAFFRRDYEKHDDIRFKEKISSRYLTPQSKKLFKSTIAIVVSFIIIYFGYQLMLYFSPPKLVFISPKSDRFKTESRVEVVFKVDSDASVEIFNDRVYQNKEGIVTYDFPLHEGANKLSIKLTGANGKEAWYDRVFIKVSPK